MAGTFGKALVAVLVGGVGVGVAAAGGSKITTVQKYPIILPAVLFGIGILLLRRGRVVSGLALIGAAGAIGGLQLLVKLGGGATAAAPAPQPQAQTAGFGDAGNAGALFGAGGKGLLAAQNSMGFGDAGAIFGNKGAFWQAADAMGFETG